MIQILTGVIRNKVSYLNTLFKLSFFKTEIKNSVVYVGLRSSREGLMLTTENIIKRISGRRQFIEP